MRRDTSSVSCSLNCAGAERSVLSRNSITSALLRAGRLLVPLKMTSSMPAARSDLCEVSPMTQRSASTRLDLPQPFGPTTPVRPCSIWKSVGSTKDLKPSSRNLLSFIEFPSRTWAGAPRARRDAVIAGQANRAILESRRRMNRGGPPRNRGLPAAAALSRVESCGERSAFRQQRHDDLVELFDRGAALLHLAVHEQRRRRLHLVLFAAAFAHRHDVVVERLILQAFVECLLGH